MLRITATTTTTKNKNKEDKQFNELTYIVNPDFK